MSKVSPLNRTLLLLWLCAVAESLTAAADDCQQDGVKEATCVTEDDRDERLLSRRRRFLGFPEGSTFSCAICLTTGVVGNPNVAYLSMGMNWGIAYNLPNASWILDYANVLGYISSKGKKNMVETVEKPAIKRRYRRDLYGQLEAVIDSGTLTQPSNFDKSSAPMFESVQLPASTAALATASAHFMSDNDTEAVAETSAAPAPCVATAADIVDDNNSMAINGNVDKFPSKNQITNPASSSMTHRAHSSALTTAVEFDLWSSKNSTMAVQPLQSPAPKSSPGFPSYSSPRSAASPATVAASLSTLAPAYSSAALVPTPLQAQWQRMLSRPKRYLSFPEGSSFSVSVCFTVGIIGNPRFNYMSYGLNWGVAYDLPNTSWVLSNLHGFARQPVPPTVLRRRSKRSLYKEIERYVDSMGYNGRQCVLRALCESRQYFTRTKMTMIGEMMRVVFSMPKQRIYSRELHATPEINLYDSAYRHGRYANCEEQYNCEFSLLELAFGKYSTPPKDYYREHN